MSGALRTSKASRAPSRRNSTTVSVSPEPASTTVSARSPSQRASVKTLAVTCQAGFIPHSLQKLLRSTVHKTKDDSRNVAARNRGRYIRLYHKHAEILKQPADSRAVMHSTCFWELSPPLPGRRSSTLTAHGNLSLKRHNNRKNSQECSWRHSRVAQCVLSEL